MRYTLNLTTCGIWKETHLSVRNHHNPSTFTYGGWQNKKNSGEAVLNVWDLNSKFLLALLFYEYFGLESSQIYHLHGENRYCYPPIRSSGLTPPPKYRKYGY